MWAANRLWVPGANDQQAVTNHGPIGTVSGDFIKVNGKHTLNFGATGVEQVFGQHPYYQDNCSSPASSRRAPNPLSGSGFASGNGVAEMLLGVIDSGTDGRLFRQPARIESPHRRVSAGRLETDSQSHPQSRDAL